MLYFFSGDRNAARKSAQVIEGKNKKRDVIRISDANSVADLQTSLGGGGMFGTLRVVVLDSTLGNTEMQPLVLNSLPKLKDSDDIFILIEEKIDAATKKQVEKYAEESKKFDAPKGKAQSNSIFALANALKRGDKKALWVGYQKELQGSAPEAIHGVLFWAAKQMVLQSRGEEERARAKKMIEILAELPHFSRRRGVELEYALEEFVLKIAPAP